VKYLSVTISDQPTGQYHISRGMKTEKPGQSLSGVCFLLDKPPI